MRAFVAPDDVDRLIELSTKLERLQQDNQTLTPEEYKEMADVLWNYAEWTMEVLGRGWDAIDQNYILP
jgi:hypothetical protein